MGDVSSDGRKDVCRTGTMKVTESMGSSICESEVTAKNVIQDMSSPGGSPVRFRREKLLFVILMVCLGISLQSTVTLTCHMEKFKANMPS